MDGENFPAAPIEAVVGRHPDVLLASVYGVPDADSGDQVMAGPRPAGRRRPSTRAAFAAWLDAQPDLGPKWQPRFLRVCSALPSTPTNKILTRTLVHEKFRSDRVHGDPVFRRIRGDTSFSPFTSDDEAALRTAFEANGRATAWDL